MQECRLILDGSDVHVKDHEVRLLFVARPYLIEGFRFARFFVIADVIVDFSG